MQLIDFSGYKPEITTREISYAKSAAPLALPGLTEEDIARQYTQLEILYSDKFLYSIQNVATIIGVSYEFIRQAIRKNQIISVEFGERKFINRNELIRILIHGVKYAN